jgi:hypothetical protein
MTAAIPVLTKEGEKIHSWRGRERGFSESPLSISVYTSATV